MLMCSALVNGCGHCQGSQGMFHDACAVLLLQFLVILEKMLNSEREGRHGGLKVLRGPKLLSKGQKERSILDASCLAPPTFCPPADWCVV